MTSPTLTPKRTSLKRFEPSKDPPPMAMMETDRAIIRAVYQFRALTREQIQKLLFPTDLANKLQRRLKLLYHHRYLERIAMPIGDNTWVKKPVYRLTKRGAEFIALEQKLPVEEVQYWGKGDDKDQRSTHVTLLFLEHRLAINDVRIAFTSAAVKHGYAIGEWLNDADLENPEHKDFATVTIGEGDKAKKIARPVLPDSYFYLDLGEKREAHFFLEVDRATMTHTRWAQKVEVYKSYLESGKYRERYKTRSIRILTTTTTDQRARELKKTTEKAEGKRFWFTTQEKILEHDPITDPIWYREGADEQAALIDPSRL